MKVYSFIYVVFWQLMLFGLCTDCFSNNLFLNMILCTLLFLYLVLFFNFTFAPYAIWFYVSHGVVLISYFACHRSIRYGLIASVLFLNDVFL
jgi:hypothetical protein